MDASMIKPVYAPSGWSTTLCGCSEDTGNCCDVLFCYPCNMQKQWNKRNNMEECELMVCVVFCGAYSVMGMNFQHRRMLEDRYNMMRETECMHCLKAMFCTVCSQCQTAREMSNHGEHPGGCCCGKVGPETVLVPAIPNPLYSATSVVPMGAPAKELDEKTV